MSAQPHERARPVPGDKLYWTVAEAAVELGISVGHLRNEKNAGRIGYVQRGHGCRVRFRREHLDDYARGVDPLIDELARRRAGGAR